MLERFCFFGRETYSGNVLDSVIKIVYADALIYFRYLERRYPEGKSKILTNFVYRFNWIRPDEGF